MSAQGYEIVDHEKVQRMLEASPPANDARQEGYALVNVLDRAQFEREHIPGSINIPQEEIDRFGQRFDAEKPIFVYCASPECPASRQVAETLSRRGFDHVYEYEGGLSDWKQAGHEVEGDAH